MEFLILGPLEVRNGGKTLRLGAAKQRALLGVLLLHANETVSTSRLIDELWGERPPATAEKLVHGYVHALRKQLGSGVLETHTPGYRLRVEPRSLDLLEFERLTEEARVASVSHSIELRRRALALWRGPPLDDVALEGPERHHLGRLNELRLTAQIERIDAELQLGRHAQLVGELEALVAEQPFQERASALLMLALYRSGRQAEALDVCRRVRRRLNDELGLQPGQELRDLEAAILRQDDSLTPPADAASAPAVEPTSTVDRMTSAAPASRRSRTAVGVVLTLLAVSAVAVAAFLLRGTPEPVVVPPNSVAAIDPATNRVTAILQTGIQPGPVAAGARSIWVGNLDDRSLTRIDPAKRTVAGTIPLPATPAAIAVGDEAVWVMNGRLGTLYRVHPQFGVHPQFETVLPVEFGVRSIRNTGAGVDIGEGSVWAAFGESTLARANPETLAASAASSAGAAPAALVVAFGSIWVANSGDATVRRFSPRTYELGDVGMFTVGGAPSGIAAGDGSIWVACTDDDYVARLSADLASSSSVPIPVGDGPTSVAFGAGAAWVANTAEGTVSRIDPETNDAESIEVGNAPAGIAVSGGLVWVSVQAP
jgi:DNA-binding SARP family transcriptional activator/DNA-binding beta-propeller fold protein YncE